jgi:hypothetical protein
MALPLKGLTLLAGASGNNLGPGNGGVVAEARAQVFIFDVAAGRDNRGLLVSAFAGSCEDKRHRQG